MTDDIQDTGGGPVSAPDDAAVPGNGAGGDVQLVDGAVESEAEVGVESEVAAVEAPPDGGAKDLGPLKEAIEALVFVHRGILPPKTVREVLGEEFTAEEIAAGFAALREDYEQRGGALVLLEVAGGYQFGTRTDLARWIQKLDFYEHHRHLSRPTMETLAIIAYKQPVTRAEIEAIRGVNVERITRNLIERKLVRILGHKDVPGKPTVLGTTRDFLELFGLNSLADLPPLKDFVEPPLPDEGDEAPGGEVPAGADGTRDDAAAAAAGSEGEGSEHGSSEAGDGETAATGDGGDPAAGTGRED